MGISGSREMIPQDSNAVDEIVALLRKLSQKECGGKQHPNPESHVIVMLIHLSCGRQWNSMYL